MSFDISKLKSPPVDSSFEVNGGLIEFTLDPDIITGKFLEETRDSVQKEVDAGTLVEESKQARFMAKVLARMITKWSVTDKGKAVKPSIEFFMELPVKLVSDMFSFAMEAIVPKPKTTERQSEDSTLRAVG